MSLPAHLPPFFPIVPPSAVAPAARAAPAQQNALASAIAAEVAKQLAAASAPAPAASAPAPAAAPAPAPAAPKNYVFDIGKSFGPHNGKWALTEEGERRQLPIRSFQFNCGPLKNPVQRRAVKSMLVWLAAQSGCWIVPKECLKHTRYDTIKSQIAQCDFEFLTNTLAGLHQPERRANDNKTAKAFFHILGGDDWKTGVLRAQRMVRDLRDSITPEDLAVTQARADVQEQRARLKHAEMKLAKAQRDQRLAKKRKRPATDPATDPETDSATDRAKHAKHAVTPAVTPAATPAAVTPAATPAH